MPKMVGEGSAREREEKVVMASSKADKGWILGIARLNHMTKSLLSVTLFQIFYTIVLPHEFETRAVMYCYFIQR